MRRHRQLRGIIIHLSLVCPARGMRAGERARMDIHIVRITCDALISIADGDGYVKGEGEGLLR